MDSNKILQILYDEGIIDFEGDEDNLIMNVPTNIVKTGQFVVDVFRVGYKKTLKVIDGMIKEQKKEYQRCKNGRTTRMKNADSKNWGMADAENRIEHYKEIIKRLNTTEESS